MNKSNRNWIVDIEDILSSGLRKSVTSYYRENYKDSKVSYLQMIERKLPRNHRVQTPIKEEKYLNRLDVYGWLTLIIRGWHEVFDGKFSDRNALNWAHELRNLRHQNAHMNPADPFTDEATVRGAQTARLLLEKLGATQEADEVKNIEASFGSDTHEKLEQVEERKRHLELLNKYANEQLFELRTKYEELEPYLSKLRILVEILVRLQQNSFEVGVDGELVQADYFDLAILTYLGQLKSRDESYQLPSKYGEVSQKYEHKHFRWLERIAETEALAASYEAYTQASSEPSLELQPSTTPEVGTPHGEQARVIHVHNGDAIDVELNGERRRVRYIGINALEGCKSANADLVEGRIVTLVRDVSDTDRFGRLLRYVYVDGIFVNETLIRDGFACTSPWPPDIRYRNWFRELELQAQNPHDDDVPY